MEEKEENMWMVLVDTSLDTHMAMSLSPTATVADFKRQFETMHPVYFPHIGGIKINAIMVKRRRRYYRLVEDIVLKNLFQERKTSHRCLRVDATPSDDDGDLRNKEMCSPEEAQNVWMCMSKVAGPRHFPDVHPSHSETGSCASSVCSHSISC